MIRDLRLALRTLWRQPGFSALAITILTLGLGAATAMFSLVDALLLRPLPYVDSERLVRIHRTVGGDTADRQHSIGAYHDFRAQDVFEGMAGIAMDNVSLTVEPGQAPDMMWGAAVTPDYFDVFRVQPLLGRLFSAEEYLAGQERPVLLSSQLWASRFGSDPGVLGRRIRLEDGVHTVVGVMPPVLHDPMRFWARGLLWMPLQLAPGARNDYQVPQLRLVGRLKPGVSVRSAQAAVSGVAARIDNVHRNGSGALLVPPQETGSMDVAGNRVAWLSLGLAVFVLLLACINLAGVQLARLAGRGHDLAIRMALGAGRVRLVREMVTEGLVLSVIGGLASIPLAQWCAELVGSRMTFGFVRATVGVPVQLDGRVMGFAAILVVVTALVVGTVPAWLSARGTVAATLRGGGRGATDGSWPRLRQGLVVAEMALALVLLAAGGLFVRGLQRFVDSDPGWRVDGLLTARLQLPGPGWRGPSSGAGFERLQQRLAALPGVEGVALGDLPLWENGERGAALRVEGAPLSRPGEAPTAFFKAVNHDYMRTLGMTLREGRSFTPADGATPDVVIINATMAARLWPGQSALGKRFGWDDGDTSRPGYWLTVVGVVADTRPAASLGTPTTRFQVYRPMRFAFINGTMLALRTRSPPSTLVTGLRRAIAELDPQAPVYEVHSARALVDRSLVNFSLIAWTLFGFAGLGVVLSALGVYGLFAGYVVQRRREIGVRMALGAQAGQVLRLVLGKGMRLALLGGGLGVMGGMAVAPLLTSAAPELPAHDPTGVAALAVLLVAVALFACWLPARRAAALDPMVALRQD